MVTYIQQQITDESFPADYRYCVTTETLAKMAIEHGVVIEGTPRAESAIWIELDEWTLDKVEGLVKLLDRLLHKHFYYQISGVKGKSLFVFRQCADNLWMVLSDLPPVENFLETDTVIDSNNVCYLKNSIQEIPFKETTVSLLALDIQAINPFYDNYCEVVNNRLQLTRPLPQTLLELVEDLKSIPLDKHFYVQGEIDTICFVRVSKDLFCYTRVSDMFEPVEANN